MRDEINKDKSKYDSWMEKYDTHDKEYRILMERLWEWEKINAKNDIARGGFFLGETSLKLSDATSHMHPANIAKNNNIPSSNNPSTKPPPLSNPSAPHLSEIEYDLYLIKL